MPLSSSAGAEWSARGALRHWRRLGQLVDDARAIAWERRSTAVRDRLKEGGDVTWGDAAALGAEHSRLFPQQLETARSRSTVETPFPDRPALAISDLFRA